MKVQIVGLTLLLLSERPHEDLVHIIVHHVSRAAH